MDEPGTPPPQSHPDGNLQGSEEAQTFKRHGQTRHISPRDLHHQQSDLLQPLLLPGRQTFPWESALSAAALIPKFFCSPLTQLFSSTPVSFPATLQVN